jgi:hypothetical protein
MQWARRSISWTSVSPLWVRARDSSRDVDLAVGRPMVPAHTGRGYRAESRTFDRRVPRSLRSVPRRSRPEVRPGPPSRVMARAIAALPFSMIPRALDAVVLRAGRPAHSPKLSDDDASPGL